MIHIIFLVNVFFHMFRFYMNILFLDNITFP